jgi:4-hydroxy-tetrahydrodipicolinate reductase
VKHRVILWGTGFVGKMVIRELAEHPAFELAGVIVNDPAKDGVDAGEIAGIDPIGVSASTDAEAVLARGADALAYFGPTAEYAAQNIENMSLAMRAGMDVVSTSMTPFVYPKACPPQMIEQIEKTCQETGKSCFTTGIDPGFANDLFPMTLMGLCGRVDSVRIQEILDYSTYSGDYAGPMGLGQPMDFQAMLEHPNVLIFSWGHTVPMIADAIGAELEKIDTVWEKWATPERIEFPLGVVEKGHCAAIRFEIRGWVNGEPRIIVEHCNRLTTAAAGDRVSGGLRRRPQRRRLPRQRHARRQRHRSGDRRAPGALDAAGSAARSRSRHAAVGHALGASSRRRVPGANRYGAVLWLAQRGALGTAARNASRTPRSAGP